MATADGREQRVRWGAILLAAFAAVLGVLALQPIFALSLAFVHRHSDIAPMREHIRTAYEQGVLDRDGVPSQIIHRYGHMFSECVTLQLAIDDEKDSMTVALRPHVLGPFVGPCPELYDVVTGKPVEVRTDYSRYWHGWRVYMWPLLERFELPAMRAINAVVMLLGVIFFYRGLRVALGPTPALVFFAVLMSLTDIWRCWVITQHFLNLLVILTGSALFAFLYRRYRGPTFAIVYAAMFGAVFNFFDNMINPPMAPLLLAFFVMTMEPRPPHGAPFRAYRGALMFAFLVAASWFCGYALTFAMKWLIAIWAAPEGAGRTGEIVEQIMLRTFGQEKDRTLYFIPGLTTLRLIGQCFISVGSIWVVAIGASIWLTIRAHAERFDRTYFLATGLPGIIPPIWFEIVSNQSQTHMHFVYRSESAVMAMLLATAVLALRPQPSPRALWDTLRGAILPARFGVKPQN